MKVFSQAPTRISLFGGGTDLTPYASKYSGVCISFAINIRQKTILYSDDHTLVENQFPPSANPEFYYSIVQEYGVPFLINLRCEFDGIIESGLGSSASAAVSLLGAINRQLDMHMTPSMIAEKAWDLEVNKLGLYGGKQDQYAAALGGMNVFEFDHEVKWTRLTDELASNISKQFVLMYLGFNRESPTIQNELKILSEDKVNELNIIKVIALEAAENIVHYDLNKIAELLRQSWEHKKKANSKVSTPKIDRIYDTALKNGAIAGKLLGSGGGGYMAFMVPQLEQPWFIDRMRQDLKHWDFELDKQGLDTRVVEF